MAGKAWHDLTHAHLCSLFSAPPSYSPWALIRPNISQSSSLFFHGPPYVFGPANIPFRRNASLNLRFFVCLVNSYSSFDTQIRHPAPVTPLLSSCGSRTAPRLLPQPATSLPVSAGYPNLCRILTHHQVTAHSLASH